MSEPSIVTALFPELIWFQNEFHKDYGILLSDLGVLEVCPREDLERSIAQRKASGQYLTRRELAHKALIPGLVNTHSHAFQRAIRGRTEYPLAARRCEENFWSWREIMYQTASQLEPLDVEAVSQAVYVEMVKAGITRVGEFHYLHHQKSGEPYPEADELANRVFSAARSAGLKVTLLRSFYQRAGVGKSLPEGAQKIFCDPSVDYYLQTLEGLRSRGHDVGVTAHSVRAVTREGLERLIAFASSENLPFHIHIAEQPREIEECLQEHGQRPVEFLNEIGGLGERTSLVHAIHLSTEEVKLVGEAGCTISSCPTTERNLGDGIVPARELLKAGARFAFGSDSQCQVSLFEDARQLDYHLRLRDLSRSALANSQERAGRQFMDMMTVNGARSLGQSTSGRLEPGATADAVAIDLNHLSIAGASPSSLAVDLVFSADPAVVSDVWIDAAEVVVDGHHRAERQAQDNLRRVFTKLREI